MNKIKTTDNECHRMKEYTKTLKNFLVHKHIEPCDRHLNKFRIQISLEEIFPDLNENDPQILVIVGPWLNFIKNRYSTTLSVCSILKSDVWTYFRHNPDM